MRASDLGYRVGVGKFVAITSDPIKAVIVDDNAHSDIAIACYFLLFWMVIRSIPCPYLFVTLWKPGWKILFSLLKNWYTLFRLLTNLQWGISLPQHPTLFHKFQGLYWYLVMVLVIFLFLPDLSNSEGSRPASILKWKRKKSGGFPQDENILRASRSPLNSKLFIRTEAISQSHQEKWNF